MRYKNISGMFFGLVTKHACDRRTDRQTDRIMTPKTSLAQLRRAVKIVCFSRFRGGPLDIINLMQSMKANTINKTVKALVYDVNASSSGT